MDPKKITELAKLLRDNGDKILSSEFTLRLSASLLRALNDSFTLIADSLEIGDVQNFQVVKPINSKSPVFRDLQLVHDFVQKTTLLCIILYPGEECSEGKIDITKFRALKRLEIQKVSVKQICGIQPLRGQLQHLICTKSIKCVDDIITKCGGDNSNGFVWNELKIADFSYNNLQAVNTSLEFAQYLEHLNLRHNKLQSVNAIKWLPHLKTLDLSFNRLQSIPQFHMDAYKRLQSLNMSNNLLEDLMGIVKLDALRDLDLSDNFLLDHTCLLPLSAISSLKYLNLYGNPLQCHPKHRLASCQYLHKNCSTVKFILDFEYLTKNEKSVTGTHQLRLVGALNHYTTRSSTSSLTAVSRITPTSFNNQTPASSVGSIVSFKINGNNSDTSEANNTGEAIVKPLRKKPSKVRHAEIEDDIIESGDHLDSLVAAKAALNNLNISSEDKEDHLEIKGQIVNLRKKYGNEWLHTGSAEMRKSVFGLEPANTSDISIDLERQKSRAIFNEYVKDISNDSNNDISNTTVCTSTPTNSRVDNTLASLVLTPIKAQTENNQATTSLYESLEHTKTLVNYTTASDETFYKSLDSTKMEGKNPFEQSVDGEEEAETKSEIEKGEEDDILSAIYSAANNEIIEEELSDREEDEETYIVYTTNENETIFLTKSSQYLRERDPLTEKTKTKWSLKILESCDRIKSNTLRINFDTVKKDKQERVYTVEEDLCQELEKKLRDILSQRDLTEMNQTIYRCVNCSCQFSQETKTGFKKSETRCPECKSYFVAEIYDIPKSLEKSVYTEKLSPASIVEELPASITPLAVQKSMASRTNSIEDSNSIGSANSLNGSSCSKITTNSQTESSFNSNQSLVGSSNTDRDLDFKTNGESDIDIISNPSQSSIEVLDSCVSRKHWEDKRSIAHVPNLETIDDQSYTQTFLEREFDNMINYANKDKDMPEECSQFEQESNETAATPAAVANDTDIPNSIHKQSTSTVMVSNNLTESSSSGSVTDSICTAYEQKAEKAALQSTAEEKDRYISKEFLQHETLKSTTDQNAKKDDNSGLSSIFGALMQSTNILMSSSKKLIDSETLSNVKSGTALPSNATANSKSSQPAAIQLYKFNYTDFSDIDHRLKLYFYQTKFEKNEHFKWLVKGRIFNELNKKLTEGIIVMSNCKMYVMEVYAAENDDVAKWLRPIVSCTVDRLQTIQLLPWKMGLSFYLSDWGGFLLLLQDILRTDSLILFFANDALPSSCELKYQPAEILTKRLSSAVMDEQLNIFSLLVSCEITCENAKRSFDICSLLATDTRIYLSSEKLNWLSELDHDSDIELCVTQFMSNLVEVEHCSDNTFIINFLDETQDKCELWKCTFQTGENANTCLNSIAQSWEKLFGVPLINA